MAEIAQYQEADREQFLLEGAEKETGPLLFYTSSVPTSTGPLSEAFQEKYGLEVEVNRLDGADLVPRVLEEYAAGQHLADLIETTTETLIPLGEQGVLQQFTVQEQDTFGPGAIDDSGLFAVTRESYIGLAYNTNMLSENEVPQTYQDLLDPKWRGKMGTDTANSTTRWIGGLLLTEGQEFLDGLAAQEITPYPISPRAIADQIIAGEVLMSPVSFDSHVSDSKATGAPIEWRALGPVVVNAGSVALPAESSRPYTAVLYLDFLLSAEGQAIYAESGYNSARTDLPPVTELAAEKIYLSAEYDEYEASYAEWDTLKQRILGM